MSASLKVSPVPLPSSLSKQPTDNEVALQQITPHINTASNTISSSRNMPQAIAVL